MPVTYTMTTEDPRLFTANMSVTGNVSYGTLFEGVSIVDRIHFSSSMTAANFEGGGAKSPSVSVWAVANMRAWRSQAAGRWAEHCRCTGRTGSDQRR
jgi:hypothetical protein